MLLIQGAHVTSSGWTATSSLFLTSILALNTLGASVGVLARTISKGSNKILTASRGVGKMLKGHTGKQRCLETPQ